MDGKDRRIDNVFIERLWRSVKHEEVYLHAYTSSTEARTALTRYFSFYNARRSHQALEYRRPDEAYFEALASSTPIAAGAVTSNPTPDELLPPAAADRGSGVRLTQTDEIGIINRRGRSTYPQEKSVRRSGATPLAQCPGVADRPSGRPYAARNSHRRF